MQSKTKGLGDSFEKLAYAYFHTDPKFQNIKNVWRQKDIPFDVQSLLGLPTNDIGIDLLLESTDGDFYPVQCKYHSDPNRAVGWKEASTFIGLLNSIHHFKAGYLCSNAYDVSSNYDKAHSGKPIVRLLGSIWDNVESEPTADSRPEIVPLKPRPHQQKAINEAVEYFEKEGNSRGKLIFPCGAGKSLTGFWITQELTAQSILIAVPSLALVKQTLEVYLREIAANKKQARWLCVCSDQEIGTNEEVKMHTSDLGVPCTTDPIEIRNWLTQPKKEQQIVFTTYQSGRLVADISKQEGFAFDLAILDEAHKTVGSTGKLFSYLLFDQNIEIRKRIFMTATERFYSGTKDDIVSMDDPEVYGEVFTQMTFKEAIDQQLLTDYKVITIDVAKKEIADFIRDNKLVELDSKWGTETEARSLAAMIALRKAMKALPIRNAVSFHSSIAKAERNDKLQKHITATYNLPSISSYTVSGKMSTGQRDRIVTEFASKKGALITNARCLTEGVDVPNIDCIVFADPRKSRIDIVQALGRALRRKESKDWGYVILPVVYDGDTHEIDNDNFQELVSIIRGLAANDERIIEHFKDKQSLNATSGRGMTSEQFIFLTEALEESEFQDQIGIKLWEGLSRFNWMPFEEARYYARSLELKSQTEWIEFCKGPERNKQIPQDPRAVYKVQWKGYGDWLGTGRLHWKDVEFASFEMAKELVAKLQLKSTQDWRDYCKSPDFDKTIPKSPEKVYSYYWNGWQDFLGYPDKFLSFEQAREYVRQLGFRKYQDFLEFSQTIHFPHFLPKIPSQTYKNQGWISHRDWIGTLYKSFEEARKYVHTLNLANEREWKQFCVSGNLPLDIPKNPRNVYRQHFKNLADWLGPNAQPSTREERYLEYELARQISAKSRTKSQKEWQAFVRSSGLPDGVPYAPNVVYKNNGWKTWRDWGGLQFYTYDEARDLARRLGLDSVEIWKTYTKSKEFDVRLPKDPNKYYSDFQGFIDFLNTDKLSQIREFYSFEDAKCYVQSLELRSYRDYKRYTTKPEFNSRLPKKPDNFYNKKGWKGWKDWLGTSENKWLSYEEARAFVRSKGIQSQSEWVQFCKLGLRPSNIPSAPNKVYSDDKWKGWKDFLGTS